MKDYYRKLNLLLRQIFDAWQESIPKLAAEAGLHHDTVYKLYYRETRYPRFLTVYALAKAVGFELELKAIKKYRKVG